MYVNLCLLIEKNVQILKNARIILYGGFFWGIVCVTVRDFGDGAWVGQTRDRTMAKAWTGVPSVAGTTSMVPSLP